MVCHLNCILIGQSSFVTFGLAFRLAFARCGLLLGLTSIIFTSVSRAALAPIFGFSTDFLVLLLVVSWNYFIKEGEDDILRHLLGVHTLSGYVCIFRFYCISLLVAFDVNPFLFLWDSPVRILPNNC